jgi:hypothetical protein
MHQELDPDGLPSVWRQIDGLVNPSLGIQTLMEDSLQDIAVDVCDVGVLPVKVDGVGCTIPMPEAQSTEAYGWHSKLLVKRTIARRFSSRKSTKSVARISRKRREVSVVGLSVCDHRQIIVIEDYPWREAAGLKSLVLYRPTVARCWC